MAAKIFAAILKRFFSLMLIENEFTIQNKLGLHARSAAQLAKIANRFSCEVKVARNSNFVNGKSIMGLLTLAAAKGSKIRVTCEGDDAKEAMQAIGDLINAKFGEE